MKIRNCGRRTYTPAEIDEIVARSTIYKPSAVLPVGAERAAGSPSGMRTVLNGPLTNRGGSGQEPCQPVSAEMPVRGVLVLTDGGVRIRPEQSPRSGNSCFVDFASVTFGEAAIGRLSDAKPFTDREHAEAIAVYAVEALLGVKADILPMRGGIFGFVAAVKIGDYGIAAAGGNKGACYLSFSGLAFAVADDEFPIRLHRFVQGVGSAQLTRIDLAYDDAEGELFALKSIPARWERGEFSSPRAPKLPKFEQRGSWLSGDPDGAGLTAYIGSRVSGKLLRIYEKGKQLGDVQSPWVRAEAELRNSVFALVADMLIHPTAFFVMLCPAFAAVAYAGKEGKIERQAKEALTTLDAVLDNIKTQYGGYLDVLRKERYFESDSELLDRLCRVPRVVPAVLRKLNGLSGAALAAGALQPSMSADVN